MPYREFRTPDDLMKALNGIDTILIDVTERDHRRPEDDAAQRGHYSGKKKTCRQKHSDGDPRYSNFSLSDNQFDCIIYM
jgi:hypothetical protein